MGDTTGQDEMEAERSSVGTESGGGNSSHSGGSGDVPSFPEYGGHVRATFFEDPLNAIAWADKALDHIENCHKLIAQLRNEQNPLRVINQRIDAVTSMSDPDKDYAKQAAKDAYNMGKHHVQSGVRKALNIPETSMW